LPTIARLRWTRPPACRRSSVRELARKPDALERILDYLRDAINLRFGDDRDEVIDYFEEMSPGLQALALNVFIHNPCASWDDLVAKVRGLSSRCSFRSDLG
jgi:hypothetical protein